MEREKRGVERERAQVACEAFSGQDVQRERERERERGGLQSDSPLYSNLLCIWCLSRHDSKFPTGRHQWRNHCLQKTACQSRSSRSRRSERAVITRDIFLEKRGVDQL